MTNLQLLLNINEAILILANKQTIVDNKGWALRGSALDIARTTLKHAREYLSTQAEELGNNLEQDLSTWESYCDCQ